MSEVEVEMEVGTEQANVQGAAGENAEQTAAAGEEKGRKGEEDFLRGDLQFNLRLGRIGLMIFVTFVCCILFFFAVFRYEGFADGWRTVTKAAQPIIIGLVIAYLINPVMKAAERLFYRLLAPRIKTGQKAKKTSRVLGIVAALLVMFAVIVLLAAAVVPSLVSSIAGLVDTVPGYVRDFVKMVEGGVLGNFEVTEVVADYLTKIVEYLQEWLKETILPQAQDYIGEITSGVISVVKTFLNFIIGIIVAVYVLMIKEKLIGQSKKVVFAVFKPRWANWIVELFHKADDIFGGFIIGKIIDSAIIGVICYVGCAIMHIPDAMLVSVIIGVTNVIPVFGPFIGAIPSLVLVVIQSPWHALYLLVFIIVLQQVDGNIIGPKILGSSTGLSSFWVMFAILIFGGMFGFVGMLLGVPVFAMVYYVLRRLVTHWIGGRGLPKETEAYVHASGVDIATHSLVYQEEPKKKKKKK